MTAGPVAGQRCPWPCLWFLLGMALLTGCASSGPHRPILQTVPMGRLTWAGEMPVLHLSGTPYDMGYQHGSLLRPEVRASVKNILAYADRRVGVPGLGRFWARRVLDRTWRRMKPHVPDRYLEEMEGLADGAGVPLKSIERIHALPEWVLLSGSEKKLQRYAAFLVRHPARGHAFVNAGWLGFIGVLSGVNDKKISIGEGAAKSLETVPAGTAVPFLLRRILEESGDLKEAAEILQTGSRRNGSPDVVSATPQGIYQTLDLDRIFTAADGEETSK